MLNRQKPIFSLNLLTGLLLVGLAFAGVTSSAEENVRPGVNRHYQDPDFESWVSVFESPGREVYDKRREIVDALNLRPGMTIADVGAGTGLFTRLFAREVGGKGKVYAVDIARNFVDNILRTGKEQGLSNIIGIVNNQKSTLLPENSVDLVFISDTYHHFEYPQSMLRSIRTALRSKGRLVVIDFRKQQGVSSGWVMSHVRASKEHVVQEVEQAGFRNLGQPDFLVDNFFLVFEKVH